MNLFCQNGLYNLNFLELPNLKTRAGRLLALHLPILVVFFGLLVFDASAQVISPQLIQQLEGMPRAQQEALARQYGVDLDQILGSTASDDNASRIALPGTQLDQKEPGYTYLDSQKNFQLFQEKFAEFEKSLLKEKEDIKRYGSALFDAEVTTFAPTDDASVPDDYRLGPGDQLVVQLFGTSTELYDLQVNRDGRINFPKVGAIDIAGLTYEDARGVIQSRVKDQIMGARAFISMGRLRAINIFVAGEVAVPGAYAVSAMTTVSQALFQAGGVSEIGSLRNIQVKRGGEAVVTFDVYQLLLKGDASNDVRLRSGDVVFVPPYSGVAEVSGAVKRPMVYEFVDGESISDLVHMAGGLDQKAYGKAAVVVGSGGDRYRPSAINIDLTDLNRPRMALTNGDKLKVPQRSESLENAITIEGAVVRPGIYGWVPEQRVSDLITSISNDLLPYADLSYALIVRVKNAELDIDILRIDLSNAISNPNSEDDVLTKPRDKLLVFSKPKIKDISSLNAENGDEVEDEIEAGINATARNELLKPIISKLRSQARNDEPTRTVSISGAIKAPGDYPLGKQDTVADLIAAGGGLTDDVYLPSAELRRIFLGKDDTMLSEYIPVDLQKILAGDTRVALKSRDHVFVRARPNWNPTDYVTIDGEVRFPGTYRIRKNELLSEVIARAGGLTVDAFPEGSIFTRKSVAEQESLRSKQFSRSIIRDFASAQLTKEDRIARTGEVREIAGILESFEGSGRLFVDVVSALSGDRLADITLEHEDSLTIPLSTYTVTVVGEIRRPGTHSFQDGLDFEDYIGLSAGMTARADREELYVVRANGSVMRPETSWLRFDGGSNSILPGDTIVVPINQGYTDNLTLWREVTQVIFNTTSGLASIFAVTK